MLVAGPGCKKPMTLKVKMPTMLKNIHQIAFLGHKVGIEGLISTIDDKEELRQKLIELTNYHRKLLHGIVKT